MLLGELYELVSHLMRVGIPEWPTEERRKPQPQHSTQIAIRGRTQHAFLQAANRLVDKQQDQPILNLLGTEPSGLRTSYQPIHVWIRLLRGPRIRSRQQARQ